MNKRKSFEKFNDFIERVGRGGYWVNQIDGFVPIFQIMQEYTYIQVPVWAFQEWLRNKYGWDLGITFIHIIIFTVVKHYLKTFIIPYFLGKFDEKWGLWKFSNEYKAKKVHMAPWNVEVQDTLKEVCRKLEIKDHFKEL